MKNTSTLQKELGQANSAEPKKDTSKEYKPSIKMYIAMAALAVIATTAIVAGISYADSENWSGRGEKGKAVLEAIENNDYNSWLKAIGDKPIGDKITEENFSKIVEMNNLMKEGKVEEAQVIADELGIRKGEFGGRMMGVKFGKGDFMGMNEDARNALDNNDYTAWSEAVAGSPVADKINEDNFSKLVESHKLMQEGQIKFDEAQKIREELGLNIGRGFGPNSMHGNLK